MTAKPPPSSDLRPRQRIRAVWRLGLFFGHLILTYALYQAGTVIRYRSESARRSWREKQLLGWSQRTLRFLGLRYEIEGPIPEPPALIASNHLGYLDILLLAGIMPARFLSKMEVKSWPVLGGITAEMQTLFIDRTRRSDVRRVMQEMKRVLEEGESLVFFPEGTSHDGSDILPLRSPLLQVPVELDQPVIPVGIRYASNDPEFPAERDMCWWGEVDFFPHFFRFCGLPSSRAVITFRKKIPPGTDRKELAVRLREELRQATGHEGETP